MYVSEVSRHCTVIKGNGYESELAGKNLHIQIKHLSDGLFIPFVVNLKAECGKVHLQSYLLSQAALDQLKLSQHLSKCSSKNCRRTLAVIHPKYGDPLRKQYPVLLTNGERYILSV